MKVCRSVAAKKTKRDKILSYCSILICCLAPSGPPTMIKVAFLNGTMINFTWSPPARELRNGAIIVYAICIQEFGRLLACQKRYVSGRQNYYVYGNLDPNKEYIIMIKAGTAAGLGPPRFLRKTIGKSKNFKGVINYSPVPYFILYP